MTMSNPEERDRLGQGEARLRDRVRRRVDRVVGRAAEVRFREVRVVELAAAKVRPRAVRLGQIRLAEIDLPRGAADEPAARQRETEEGGVTEQAVIEMDGEEEFGDDGVPGLRPVDADQFGRREADIGEAAAMTPSPD